MPEKLPKPDTVMVIDDSTFDQKIIYRILNYTNLFKNVLIFPGGIEALNYITDNLDKPEMLPQLILLDIQMPEMDGFEFTENFIKLPGHVKERCLIALLSSTDDVSDFARAESNRAIIRLLKKPLHPNCLKKLLSEFYLVD